MARTATSMQEIGHIMDAPTDTTTPVSQRPTPPEGMTYSRKGKLVKKRIQTARSNNLFLVMQVKDGDGNLLPKKSVNIVGQFRSSDKVLELIDSGEHDGAFYMRVNLTQPK